MDTWPLEAFIIAIYGSAKRLAAAVRLSEMYIHEQSFMPHTGCVKLVDRKVDKLP